MKRFATTVLLGVCLNAAHASKKDDQPFQEATVVSFQTVTDGASCAANGNTNGNVDINGNITASQNTTATCTPQKRALYTIKVGEQKLVLTPTLTTGGKTASALSLGWSRVVAGNSVLYGQLPGSTVLVRSEDGNIRVKVGKRDSLYRLVNAN